MTKYISESEFDETTREGFWIADFYTEHCGPCKMLDLVLSDILVDNPQINLAKCDIEKSPAFSDRFEIMGTPTLLFLMNGQMMHRISGYQPRSVLEDLISEIMYGA